MLALEERALNEADPSIIGLTTTASATENAIVTTISVLASTAVTTYKPKHTVTTTVTEMGTAATIVTQTSTVVASSTAPPKPFPTYCGQITRSRYLECNPGQICIGDDWGRKPRDGVYGTCVRPDGPNCESVRSCDDTEYDIGDLVCVGGMEDGCIDIPCTEKESCCGHCARRNGKPYY